MSFNSLNSVEILPDIRIEKTEQGLDIHLETSRLTIRSVHKKDIQSLVELYADKEVMLQVATGQTCSEERVKKRVTDIWIKRWQNHDPFSGLTILEKTTGHFVGRIMLRPTADAGCAELVYVLAKKFWGKGYATEAVSVIVQHLAPLLAQQNFNLKGMPLSSIIASVSVDNLPSNAVAKKFLTFDSLHTKYGGVRNFYRISIAS